jgi:hypothetical protein
MNTTQIAAVLKTLPYTKSKFKGVYPSDRLPADIEKYPAALVANVDSHDKPGSHWCAFYIDENQEGEFFDSYGQTPEEYSVNFKNFLDQNCKRWSYNSQVIQSLGSNVCGHYCLYYLINHCKNVSLKHIVTRFTRNSRINDRFVYQFIVKHFGYIIRRVKHIVSLQLSTSKQ